MRKVAEKLVPPSKRVGKLLGKDFRITLEGLEEGIDAVIANEIKHHDLTLFPVDTTKVNWARLIDMSVNRKPPFEDGKTEKGFRDAIVMEAFSQLVDTLPLTRSIRVILLTGDELLQRAIEERTKSDERVWSLMT